MHFNSYIKLQVSQSYLERIVLLFSLFVFVSSTHAQETPESKGKFDGLVSTGFSYGIQSLSVPPIMQKISLGLGYSTKKVSYYLLPGITVGIAPMSSTHIEIGLKYLILTFDYTVNWTSISGVSQTFVNQNLNLGLQIKLNPKKEDNLSLWLKGGKSFFERGYDEQYKPTWNGYNIELKLIWNLGDIKTAFY